MTSRQKVYTTAKSGFEVFIVKNAFKFIIGGFFSAVFLTFYFGFMDPVLFVAVLILGSVLFVAYIYSKRFAYKLVIYFDEGYVDFYMTTGGEIVRLKFQDFDFKVHLYIVFHLRDRKIVYKDTFNKALIKDLELIAASK